MDRRRPRFRHWLAGLITVSPGGVILFNVVTPGSASVGPEFVGVKVEVTTDGMNPIERRKLEHGYDQVIQRARAQQQRLQGGGW